MAYYLIDYENVNNSGMTGMNKLKENDNVIIFYSEKSDSISFETMSVILQNKFSVKWRKLKHSAQNALDFQLSTYLGYLIAKNPDEEFYIITKDKGFFAVIEFYSEFVPFGECNVQIKMFANINDAVSEKNSLYPPKETQPPLIEVKKTTVQPVAQAAKIGKSKVHSDVLALLSDLSKTWKKDEMNKVCDVLTGYITSSSDKSKLHNAITTKFGKEDGLIYYSQVKKYFDTLHK